MRSCPVRPKHLPLEDIRYLSAELTELGYQVRFEVNGFFYSFNVYWMQLEHGGSCTAKAVKVIKSDGKTGRFFTMMKTDG